MCLDWERNLQSRHGIVLLAEMFPLPLVNQMLSE